MDVDGVINNPNRRGKWTSEEEEYAEKIIADFDKGLLNIDKGTTLRSLLSSLLSCDPMRVTKKYSGIKSIGRRIFEPVDASDVNKALIVESQIALAELKRLWLDKVYLNRRRYGLNISNAVLPPYEDDSSEENMDHNIKRQKIRMKVVNGRKMDYAVNIGGTVIPTGYSRRSLMMKPPVGTRSTVTTGNGHSVHDDNVISALLALCDGK